jgi:hypothetical protein
MGPRNARDARGASQRQPALAITAPLILAQPLGSSTRMESSYRIARPRLISGAPRLALSSWYRLATDRWVEVAA